MTQTRRLPILLAAIAVLAAGCEGAKSHAAAPATTTTTARPAQSVSVAALKAGVRTAVGADLQLSLYVLWHNRVPAWATRTTRGPALAALRGAAATRRRQGIQIKNLSGHDTIVTITLGPSDKTATAVVIDKQRVAPYKSGHRLGRAITGTDHSRIELHRLGNTRRFIVWSVSPIQ